MGGPGRPGGSGATGTGAGPEVTTGSGATRVRGPVHPAWREGTWTRAKEIESLCTWLRQNSEHNGSDVLFAAVGVHLRAAEETALAPRFRLRDQALLERAMSNLDAAEALLLDVAPAAYVLGRLPGVLNDVERHLAPTDVRRRHLEHIARQVGIANASQPLPDGTTTPTMEDVNGLVERERPTIATAYRAASSAALRQQLQIRSFRNVLLVTTALLTLLVIALAVVGFVDRTAIPLCFEPQQGQQTEVVCPTGESLAPASADGAPPDVDEVVRGTVHPADILVVELVGLAAAAVAAAAAIRGIRGSSEPHGLPVALALLKLPTGALTAVLGLLLMRGQFIPGLTALDSSAQILAWALVFGYGQQLFTRLVDQQAHTVLGRIRGGRTDDRAAPSRSEATSSSR